MMRYLVQAGLLILLASAAGCRQISVTDTGDRVARYGIYEVTLTPDSSSYANPWEDVIVTMRLTNEAGQSFNVDGFYYRGNQWKVRFSPPSSGVWQWSLLFIARGEAQYATGSFRCEPSESPGFVRRHPANPYRLVFDNGSLFNALGIGDCILDVDGDGNPLNNWGFDGDFRRAGDPDYGSIVDMPVYMNAYGSYGAGFNLFRWSVDNCAFKLWDTISVNGNRYLVQEGLWGDELAAALRRSGFRIWMTLFNQPPFPEAAESPSEQAAIKRYIRYIVARHGAYVDVWELMNEADVSEDWIAFAAEYLRAIDPYRHPITTSWERPELPQIDFNAPHWYEREPEEASDARTAQAIARAQSWSKPVLFGEQGNAVQNWDERSALRMRLRSWTAFFEEGVLVFWNSSFAKDLFDPHGANLYIGPQERGYVRVLQDFTANVDAGVRRISLTPDTAGVRAYGLQSPRELLGYFHHFSDHTNPVSTAVTVNLPSTGSITWMDPATGQVLQSLSLAAGAYTLTTPYFAVDLALKIRF